MSPRLLVIPRESKPAGSRTHRSADPRGLPPRESAPEKPDTQREVEQLWWWAGF